MDYVQDILKENVTIKHNKCIPSFTYYSCKDIDFLVFTI